MARFGDLVKQARYEELAGTLGPVLDRPWSWQQLHSLLVELGVNDPYGFLAAGWWLPVDARLDPELVDKYTDAAEQAIAAGEIPPPGGRYEWSHVRRLLARCGIRPEQVVKNLLWEYIYTPGEQVFIDTLRQVASAPAPAESGQ